jgi:hypothetical protein
MDLKTDQLINRYEIPKSVVDDGYGIVSITVDVVSLNNQCEDSFAYIPDLYYNQMLVYSLKENRSWTVKHNYFFLNPYEGEYNLHGDLSGKAESIKFMWDDGIFSITLGERFGNFGYRTAFFHPMSRFH